MSFNEITGDSPAGGILPTTCRLSLLVLLSMTVALNCSWEGDPSSAPLGSTSRSIVNGTETSLYPAVGALYILGDYTWNGSRESFCSGTLITPEWVLTAAHCLFVEDLQYYMTGFFIGPNVGGTGNSYRIDAYYPNPNYDPDDPWYEHDIGLVHLAEAVPSNVATPIAYNTYSLNSRTGNPITWVGYGINNAYSQTGGGIKRMGTGYIDQLLPLVFTYEPGTNQALPCKGDSGGATLMNIESAMRVVGVVSAGDEYCSDNGIDTRVDAYRLWIEEVLETGGADTGCRLTGGDCGTQACLPVDDIVNACYPSNGIRVGSACDSNNDNWTTAVPCRDGSFCLQVSDNASDGRCFAFCHSSSDCGTNETCYFFDGMDDLGFCLEENIATPCNITGGDCPTGQACFPTIEDENYCFESSRIGYGQACNSDMDTWDNTLPCDDGLICLQTGTRDSDGQCFKFCVTNNDCRTVGGDCWIFDDIDDIGICWSEEEEVVVDPPDEEEEEVIVTPCEGDDCPRVDDPCPEGDCDPQDPGQPEDEQQWTGGGGGRSGGAVGCFSIAGEGSLNNGTWLCMLLALTWLGFWSRPRRKTS